MFSEWSTLEFILCGLKSFVGRDFIGLEPLDLEALAAHIAHPPLVLAHLDGLGLGELGWLIWLWAAFFGLFVAGSAVSAVTKDRVCFKGFIFH